MLKIFYILSIFLLFDQFNARATDYDDILQDFQEIKYQAAKTKTLFEDPFFPANNNSIGLKYLNANKKLFPNGIRWLRPHVRFQSLKKEIKI